MKNTRCVAFCAKPFCGIKQAPCKWYEKFIIDLLQVGFIKSKVDQNVYIKKAHKKKFVGLYVDDSILIINNQKH
jgi:hypothetical protein